MGEAAQIILEISVTLLIITFNVFFVIAEVAFLTSAKARLLNMARRGFMRAKQAAKLVQMPEIFLSTAQLGMTFSGLLLGWFGGVSISKQIASLF